MRHVADFVEKQRALGGGFEEAGLVAIRSGERAAHVAEELALEERLDDGGAVEDDVLAFDAAAGMQRARDQVLAGPGGSLDERGAVVRRDAADARKHLGHARAGADEAFEFRHRSRVPGGGVLLRSAVPPARAGRADGWASRGNPPRPLRMASTAVSVV